jgi:hypothetical protein
LQGLVELKKGAKRRYWPKWIPGDAIIAHFADKHVGDVYALPQMLDDVPFHVFAMKEPDYVMKLMSMVLTYGRNEQVGEWKRRAYKIGSQHHEVSFQYPKVVYNHFHYRHVIDDHNSKCHSPISLEVTWATKWWPHRVFAFLLAIIMEVNVLLASVHFGGYMKTSMLNF